MRHCTDLYPSRYRSSMDLLFGDLPITHSRIRFSDLYSHPLAIQLRYCKMRAIHDHQYRVSEQRYCHAEYLCNDANFFIDTERTLSLHRALRSPYRSFTSACQRPKVSHLRRSTSCLMDRPAMSQISRLRRVKASMRVDLNTLSTQMPRLDEYSTSIYGRGKNSRQ